MQPVPQDLLKEYVQSQHFTSTTEIMAAMKEMFRDVIQTVMEVEMDEELGRERCERSDEPEGTPRNYRKDIKKVVADLKKIYGAVTLEEAEKNLQTFAETWRKQYPSCVKSWEENWPVLSTFFEYPVEIRKIIYTTNIIEGLNRQFRQITKNKPSFTNDDSLRRMLYLASQRIASTGTPDTRTGIWCSASLLKMLYLAMIDITKKWTGRRQDWSMIHAQLAVFFADRMPE